jgi:hypothetical protein
MKEERAYVKMMVKLMVAETSTWSWSQGFSTLCDA